MSKSYASLEAVVAQGCVRDAGGKVTSLLVVRDGNVYDVAAFFADHPGGPEVILERAGRDVTRDFARVGHSPDAVKLLEKYRVGQVGAAGRGRDDSTRKGRAGLSNEERARILAEGQRGAWKAAVLPWLFGAVAAVTTYVVVASLRKQRKSL